MRYFLPIALFLLLPGVVHAQYKVGAGDVLEIEVHGQKALTGGFEVSANGEIEMELLGGVAVAGKTVAQVDEKLTADLGKFLKKPVVRVKVGKFNSQKVYLLGAVKSPGKYVLEGERMLLDLLMDAGGPADGATMKLHLMRPETTADVETLEIDLRALLVQGDFTQNVKLRAGDVLYVDGGDAPTVTGAGVPAEGTRVYVVGEVARPGLFKLEPGATAMAAVLAAGGLTKYASAGRAKVVRTDKEGRQILKVDLADILKRGRKDKDVVLQPGDMVIVPGRLF